MNYVSISQFNICCLAWQLLPSHNLSFFNWRLRNKQGKKLNAGYIKTKETGYLM